MTKPVDISRNYNNLKARNLKFYHFVVARNNKDNTNSIFINQIFLLVLGLIRVRLEIIYKKRRSCCDISWHPSKKHIFFPHYEIFEEHYSQW